MLDVPERTRTLKLFREESEGFHSSGSSVAHVARAELWKDWEVD